jgi:hypothetical protein
MKKKTVIIVFAISLCTNLILLGKFLIDKRLEPTQEEKIILSEMVQKTIESEYFKKLAEKEKIISIDTDANHLKGGVFPFYLEVDVNTKKQTYIFSCSNKQCSNVNNGGWTYSIYQDERPRLPLKDNKSN